MEQSTAKDHRAELIADLRAFADLLDARPDMPIGPYDYVRVQYSVTRLFGSEAARVAEVERVAAILGADVKRDARQVMAELPIGRRVTYLVNAGTDLGEARYTAEDSYRDAVEPDMAVAHA